jgi:glycosyltransferase domain-containing protein
MPRLFIPTRNRPTSLSNVLEYLVRFHPGTQVIVGDGSTDDYKERTGAVAERFNDGIEIDYRPYPAELPFFDRILDVLNSIEDDCIVMGADDDYPNMDLMHRGEAFLDAHPDYVTAMGALVHFNLLSITNLRVRIGVAFPIPQDNISQRVRSFLRWPFSTTYAVTRRSHLIERYKRAKKLFVTGFFDLGVGAHDIIHGKLHAFSEIGFFCTRNFNHSYLRPGDNLFFLRHGESILQLAKIVRKDIENAGVDKKIADKLAMKLFRQRMAEHVGHPTHKHKHFTMSPLFKSDIIQEQFKAFNDLFEEGTKTRAQYLDVLEYLSRSMLVNADSSDNANEKGRHETIEGQMAAS